MDMCTHRQRKRTRLIQYIDDRLGHDAGNVSLFDPSCSSHDINKQLSSRSAKRQACIWNLDDDLWKLSISVLSVLTRLTGPSLQSDRQYTHCGSHHKIKGRKACDGSSISTCSGVNCLHLSMLELC